MPCALCHLTTRACIAYQLRELVNDGDAASTAADAAQSRRVAERRRAIKSGEEELVRVIPKPAWGTDTPCVGSLM